VAGKQFFFTARLPNQPPLLTAFSTHMHMNRHTSSTTTVCRNIYNGSTQERYSNTCYLHIWADKLVEKERSLFSMSTPFRENYVVMHQPHKLTGFAQKPHFHLPQSEKEHWNTEEF
jgi:hypothetical protein